VAIHLLIWRVRLPREQTAALVKIFGATYLLALGAAMLPKLQELGPANAVQLVHFTLFFLPLALTYTSFYSLLENESPSLAMVSAIARAGSAGCTRDELVRVIGRDAIIEQRLLAAVGNGLLERTGQQWLLTGRGRLLARVFDAAAALYRLDRAG